MMRKHLIIWVICTTTNVSTTWHSKHGKLPPDWMTSSPTIWRNLALANFNKKDEEATAIEYMERAFQLDTTDARVLMELDQLYKRVRRPHSERLAFLQQYPD